MNEGKKENLKLFIIIGSISIGVTVFALFKFIDIKQENESKYLLDIGMESLSKGKYDDAIKELERSLDLDDENEEALEALEIAEDCEEIEKAFQVENYMLVEELIEDISNKEKFSLVELTLKEIIETSNEKVKIMNEIDTLDVKIDELILNKKFDESLKIINEYLKKDINEEYKNKLNKLTEKVNNARLDYDKERERIEAEEKERQEILKSQGISKEQAKKSLNVSAYKDVGLNLVWSTSKTTKLNDKYYWIWGVDYEPKDINKSLRFYVIVDIKTGKATEVKNVNGDLYKQIERIRKGY